MTTLKLAVVSAGLRSPSSTRMLADRLTEATRLGLADSRHETETDTIELVELTHDLANTLHTGFAAGDLAGAVTKVTGADGLIAVSPIFSASYSGLFKTFFDILEPDALTGMPVVIGATAGTPRHSLALEHALRPLFTYLRAVVMPTAVFAATEDWGSGGATTAQGLSERIERAAGELAASMTGRRRPSPKRDDPYDVTPFQQLLTGDS